MEKAVQKWHQQYSTVIVLNLSKTEQTLRIMNSYNDTDELLFNLLPAPSFCKGGAVLSAEGSVPAAGQELPPWVPPAPLEHSRRCAAWACLGWARCTMRLCWSYRGAPGVLSLCINYFKIKKIPKHAAFSESCLGVWNFSFDFSSCPYCECSWILRERNTSFQEHRVVAT